jgi:hypothetical protein
MQHMERLCYRIDASAVPVWTKGEKVGSWDDSNSQRHGRDAWMCDRGSERLLSGRLIHYLRAHLIVSTNHGGAPVAGKLLWLLGLAVALNDLAKERLSTAEFVSPSLRALQPFVACFVWLRFVQALR